MVAMYLIQLQILMLIFNSCFIGSFFIMCVTVYLHTIAIVANPKVEKSIQALWIIGSLVFLAGYLGWHVDFHFCSIMNSLPYNMPNPQLHAWW